MKSWGGDSRPGSIQLNVRDECTNVNPIVNISSQAKIMEPLEGAYGAIGILISMYRLFMYDKGLNCKRRRVVTS